MPIAEAVALKVANAVLGFALRELALDERLRKALGRDPAQRAYARALERAVGELDVTDPEWTAALFDASFFEHEGAPILARFLTRIGQPDPAELADAWARSIGIREGGGRPRVRELEPVALVFLESLERALKEEPAFGDVFDQRASEQMLADIAAIRDRLGAGAPTAGTKRDYLSWLIGRNLYLDPRGTLQTQRQVQLKLDSIYVTLHAQRDEAAATVDRRLTEQENLDLEAKLANSGLTAEEIEDQREGVLARRQQSAATAAPTEPVLLSQLAANHRHVVILGDPGSGKTTLLRYLALKHAQALLDGQPEAGEELGRTRQPILIRIADYTESGAWRDCSLTDFLPAYFDRLDCPAEAIGKLLETELEQGDCLVLLDGLDEIVDADDRRAVVGRIEDFVRRFETPGNQFIVTSRIAGYRSSPLTAPFVRYVVQDMDEAEITRFLGRWCRAVEDAETPDAPPDQRESVARREIDAILDAIQTSPGVARLAANPLLLRVLALIHRTGARLPQKRIELYKLAADTLARTWRTAMGVPETALVREVNLTRLLGALAFWLHSSKPTGLATHGELHAVLGEEWARMERKDWDPDDPDPAIHDEVEKFMLTVRVQTGLFVERAPKRFGFMHLTFEEYYASRHLVRAHRSAPTLIRERLHDARWDEPILLALGFYGLDFPDESSELIETAILADGADAEALGFRASDHEELLGRDFLFALRCLGDQIPLDAKVTEKLLRRATDEFVRQIGSGRFTRYSDQLFERFDAMRGGESGTTALATVFAAREGLSPVELVRAAWLAMVLSGATAEIAAMLEQALDGDDRTATADALSLIAQLPEAMPSLVARLAALATGGGDLARAAQEAMVRFPVEPDLAAALAVDFMRREEHFPSYYTTRFAAMSGDRLGTVIDLIAAERSVEYLAGFHESLALQLTGDTTQTSRFIDALRAEAEDAEARPAALTAFAVLAPYAADAREPALQALGTGSSLDRLTVARSLLPADDELAAALRFAMDDVDEQVRLVAATRLLYRRDDAAASAVITDALHSEDTKVQEDALNHIAYGPQPARLELVERIAELALGGSLEVRIPAESALRRYVGLPEAWAVLASLLEQGGERPHVIVEIALSVDPTDSSAHEALASLFESEDWTTVLYALELVERYALPVDPFREHLEKLSAHPYTEVPLAVARLLARDAGTLGEAEPIVRGLLESAEQYRTRQGAIALLGTSAAPSPELVELLLARFRDDDDNDVRAQAAKALASLGRRSPPEIAQMIERRLYEVLGDPDFLAVDRWASRTGQDYAFDALAMLVGVPAA